MTNPMSDREQAAKARIEARRAAYQLLLDEHNAAHRAYIDSLPEEQGGEQEMRKPHWGETAHLYDIGLN